VISNQKVISNSTNLKRNHELFQFILKRCVYLLCMHN